MVINGTEQETTVAMAMAMAIASFQNKFYDTSQYEPIKKSPSKTG